MTSPCRREWGLVDGRLSVSRQRTLAARSASAVLPCIGRSVASRSREVVLLFGQLTREVVDSPCLETETPPGCSPVCPV
ncbi:hypothetical protein WISP_147346 [Willisornis vidua]|uniref:Uncharacterized protein n=1 Tax=Willisornis vidua TaxID=1566151 RepID=A0ABQ9CQX9_9PASS|nr:hypothetical protein WISP_147346 [Willisornis vidua]